jgi:hypothetical protein
MQPEERRIVITGGKDLHDGVTALNTKGVSGTTGIAGHPHKLQSKISVVNTCDLAWRQRKTFIQQDGRTGWTLFVTPCDTQETKQQGRGTHDWRSSEERATATADSARRLSPGIVFRAFGSGFVHKRQDGCTVAQTFADIEPEGAAQSRHSEP